MEAIVESVDEFYSENLSPKALRLMHEPGRRRLSRSSPHVQFGPSTRRVSSSNAPRATVPHPSVDESACSCQIALDTNHHTKILDRGAGGARGTGPFGRQSRHGPLGACRVDGHPPPQVRRSRRAALQPRSWQGGGAEASRGREDVGGPRRAGHALAAWDGCLEAEPQRSPAFGQVVTRPPQAPEGATRLIGDASRPPIFHALGDAARSDPAVRIP